MRVCWRVELSWWSKDAVSMRRDLQRLISQSNSLISPCHVIFLYSSLVESFSGYQPTPPSPLSSPVAVETREWVTHPPPFYSSWQGQHEDRTLWQDNLCHILPQSFYRSVCHVMMIMHRETPVAVRQWGMAFTARVNWVHLIHEDSDSASRLIVVIWIEMKSNFWLFGNYFDWKSISQHLKQC